MLRSVPYTRNDPAKVNQRRDGVCFVYVGKFMLLPLLPQCRVHLSPHPAWCRILIINFVLRRCTAALRCDWHVYIPSTLSATELRGALGLRFRGSVNGKRVVGLLYYPPVRNMNASEGDRISSPSSSSAADCVWFTFPSGEVHGLLTYDPNRKCGVTMVARAREVIRL